MLRPVFFGLFFVLIEGAPAPQQCSREDVDFWGADIGYRTADSLESCKEFCKETAACVSLTFRFAILPIFKAVERETTDC